MDEIREANDMGIICGVTTNPSLIAKEGRDFNEVIKEITEIAVSYTHLDVYKRQEDGGVGVFWMTLQSRG